MKTSLLLTVLIGINFGLSAQVTDTGDKVGVGTTNPSQKLEVSGGNIAAYDSGNTYVLAGLNGQNHFRIGYDGTGGVLESFLNNTNSGTHIKFNTGLLTRMTISDNGNITIGGENNYDYRLSISKGNSSSRLAFINSGFSENAILEYHTSKQLRFQNWNNGVWNSNLMTLDFTNGNVGIGTIDVTHNLTVADNRPRIALVDENGDAGVIEFYEISNQIRFQKWFNNGDAFDKTIMTLGGDNGFVGIGTISPDMKLTVKGKIHAEEVKIDLSVPAPDYVFKEDYELRTLNEVEQFIEENNHLPEIPSAKEFEQNGVMQAEMDMNLLKKIEELTLYTIQQEKKIIKQAEKIKNLESLNNKLLELQKRLEKLEKK
ncbi:hypothetical protein ACOKFD_05905 [Flagellimonas sp. S174]|uniref:hypothetical protein n=1 Tax=Flagellimonas sp. S174 TaxID=3410790 RepID=UPI003BF4FF7E